MNPKKFTQLINCIVIAAFIALIYITKTIEARSYLVFSGVFTLVSFNFVAFPFVFPCMSRKTQRKVMRIEKATGLEGLREKFIGRFRSDSKEPVNAE